MARRAKSSVETRFLGQLREEVHRRFAPHRHSALLFALIAAFVVRPLIGDTGAGLLLFSIALVFLLLVALYNINVDELVGERGLLLTQAKHRRLLGWMLAIAAGAERIATIFVHNPRLDMVGTIMLAAIRRVHRGQPVAQRSEAKRGDRRNHLHGGVGLPVIRLWLGASVRNYIPAASGIFFWHRDRSPSQATEFQHIFPIFGYFSLTTLSTIGFGDITPVTLQARYAAVAEGITGQFYLAILVARLVGMQMTQSPAQHAEQKAIESGAEKK